MSLTCGHHTTLREGIDPVPMLEANCMPLCGPRELQAARGLAATSASVSARKMSARHRCHGKRSQTVPTDFPLQADVRCDGEIQARARRRAVQAGGRRPSHKDVHRLSLFRFEPTVWRRVESAGTYVKEPCHGPDTLSSIVA